MTRLLLADDHQMFRQGLRGLLAAEPSLQIVAEASNYAEVIAALRAHPIDVAILDLSMPGRDGFEMVCHARSLRPELRILVLTMHNEEQYATRALRAGADGYLTKQNAAEQLLTAVQRLAKGGQYICPQVAERLASEFSRGDAGERPDRKLSDREYKIFEMLVAGKSGSQIAQELSLSAKTVSTHKVRLLRKMNMSNQAELIRYAIANRLLTA